ncbi:unnamed protein product [Miscanthus lutarioriparius]|uniref:Uncharacterized protein n=1 Tax=Miscanthus lutarioriparius TaxID=422564 RepID=A0A811RS19_9POAL|nr:unnamed protein product [Miscanthus lutarioriparius]
MPCTCTCTCGREEPMPQHHHERTLSSNTSFSSPTASPALSYASSSTNYLPASNKLPCESIPYAESGPDDLIKLSSFSSTSSYESFFHIEALDDSNFGPGIGNEDAAAAAAADIEFLDFEPCTMRPPAVQTMIPPQQGRQRAEGAAVAAAAAYDPKRLPSSMFRTRSTNRAEWSATSNESLFSIQLSSSAADLTARYADFYYDAAGFPRFPSLGRDAAAMRQLPSLSESSGRSGGLCVRHDCARCGSGSKTRKSVRFAATESVSGEGKHKHSVVVSTYVTQQPNRSFA